MPLVRISHVAGKPEGYADALSAGVHRAMNDTFNVPADDFFQIVSEHVPGAGLRGPSSFLGVAHTTELVMIQITCAEGRSLQQKKALYAAIARNLSEAPGVRPEDVIINLVEAKRENWSFGNGIAQFAPVQENAAKTFVPAPALEGARLLHTMLRVRDLERSLGFYTGVLGMRLQRRKEFPEGRFTLAFIGYGAESDSTVLELTHNWDVHEYAMGGAYGHIAIGVRDVAAAVEAVAAAGARVTRPAGPLKGDPDELIAFIEDPDGYKVELIQRR